MAVLLIPNTIKDSGLAVTRRAAALLSDLGVTVLMPQPEEPQAELSGVLCLPEAQAYEKADQVLTIGGDGTLLRAGHACVRYGKPVLGVNLGRTGFLATCEVEELPEKLRRLAAGEYKLSTRGFWRWTTPAETGTPKPSTMWFCLAVPVCILWITKSIATDVS